MQTTSVWYPSPSRYQKSGLENIGNRWKSFATKWQVHDSAMLLPLWVHSPSHNSGSSDKLRSQVRGKITKVRSPKTWKNTKQNSQCTKELMGLWSPPGFHHQQASENRMRVAKKLDEDRLITQAARAGNASQQLFVNAPRMCSISGDTVSHPASVYNKDRPNSRNFHGVLSMMHHATNCHLLPMWNRSKLGVRICFSLGDTSQPLLESHLLAQPVPALWRVLNSFIGSLCIMSYYVGYPVNKWYKFHRVYAQGYMSIHVCTRVCADIGKDGWMDG